MNGEISAFRNLRTSAHLQLPKQRHRECLVGNGWSASCVAALQVGIERLTMLDLNVVNELTERVARHRIPQLCAVWCST